VPCPAENARHSEIYECAIKDEVTPVLKKVIEADVVVMGYPFIFSWPSAQLKIVFGQDVFFV